MNILLTQGFKSSHKKSFFFSFFFCEFCFTSRIFLVLVLLSASVERFFVFRMRDFYSRCLGLNFRDSRHCGTKNTVFLCFFITYQDNGNKYKYSLIVDGYSFTISHLGVLLAEKNVFPRCQAVLVQYDPLSQTLEKIRPDLITKLLVTTNFMVLRTR